jgi:predicted TIM-barrel fold metal-dependent hydrolase
MRRFSSIAYVGLCATVIGGIVVISATPRNAASEAFTADLDAFAQIEPIDTHAHVLKDDPEFRKFLQRYHLHLLDIVVATKDDPTFSNLESKISAAKAVVRDSKGHAVLCTTFDPFKFSNATFAADAVRHLNEDFTQGAVAVKIWKNVGMQLKDRSGRFVLPDDRRLNPIYQDVAAHGKTLIAHLAEPDSCWLPPNKNSPDYSYYNEHPEWYMFKQPDHPKKAAIIQARDHMLEQHPQLRVVGAHLGSLEKNLDELGRRFDRYSNFAVDVAARTVYLTLQPRDKARQFIVKYQDRILYGTDLAFFNGQDAATAEKKWAEQYATDWAFFSSDKTLTYRRREVKGLGLPPQVLRKLYHDNAAHWIPGIVPSESSPSTNAGRP